MFFKCKKPTYPLDLDASEKVTRYSGLYDPYPNVPIIGNVSGILPLADARLINPVSGHAVTFSGVNMLQAQFPEQRKGRD